MKIYGKLVIFLRQWWICTVVNKPVSRSSFSGRHFLEFFLLNPLISKEKSFSVHGKVTAKLPILKTFISIYFENQFRSNVNYSYK